MKTTTLAEIRSHGPCEDGFAKIRDHLGVSPADAKTHSEPFPISLLLETNGLDDALWVTAHVAPDALLRFLIRRLDDGEHSVIKTLRELDGDNDRLVEAVQTIADLLRRKLAGEGVHDELSAADAAFAAYAAADAAYTADAAYAAYAAYAADAAYAAYTAYTADAARAAYAAADAAADATAYAAADAADLISALRAA